MYNVFHKVDWRSSIQGTKMKTKVSSKAVLNLVENFFKSQKNSVILLNGICLNNGEKEVYIVIGKETIINASLNGKMALILKAFDHDSMDEAQHQAKDFIRQINELFTDIEPRI